MQIIKFVLAAALTILLVFVLDLHNPYGTALPSIGRFFSPFSGVWQNATGHQQEDTELRMPGLKEEVSVFFDERMVPHIFANDEEDLFYAQGFITAKFRLWQMDVTARNAAGRLSEVLGERTLERDRLQRRKGMLWAAERSWQAWQNSPEEKAWVEAYTHGINDYINSLSPADYPLEYKLLNFAPEPWTPVHSALFLKNMAQILCGRNDDLGATNALALLGREMFDFLYPEANSRQSPVIPKGTTWDFTPVPLEADSGTSREMISGRIFPYHGIPQPPPFLGSNNWAVDGSKTADGYPILCNDPHLDLTLPSIWFEIHLHTPGLNAYGVSLPGTPGILIGFNENIAWGETNVGQDVLDWYRIIWADEQKSKYLLDGKTKAVDVRTEIIKIKGRSAPVIESVKYTEWGPVVYEDETSAYHDLAMRWIAHDVRSDQPFHELGTFIALMRGKNYDDYIRALDNFGSPPQNFVFASRSGDIAIRVNGDFPVKGREQGRFIQDGSSSAQAWQGWIPRSQVPQVRNPERGFVASANQRSTDLTYPYYYLGNFDDYRGRLLNRLLDTMTRIRVEDMMALQNNNYSIKAEEGVPALLGQLDQSGLDEVQRRMLTDISSWDYRFEADSKAAFVFTSWLNTTYRLTFDEIYAASQDQEVVFPESWRLLELIYQHPFHIIFDLLESPEKESAKEIVTRAFEESSDELREKYLDDSFSWSDFKGTHIPHLGRIPGLGSAILTVGGYNDALNSIKNANGPSWRMIVKMGPQVEAWGVYPGGQSGHPGSPYYDNMIEQWRKGEYSRLHFPKNIEEASRLEAARWTLKKK